MKKGFIPLFILFIFSMGCMNKELFVPEISQNIIHENVYSIEESENLLKIIPNKEDMFLIFRDGKIIRINSNTFLKNSQYQCLFKFESKVEVFENIIVLSSLDGNKYLFDLNKMEVIFRWKKDQFKNIKYADANIIIYRSLENMIVFDYIKKKELAKLFVKGETIQNCFVKNKKVIICTTEKILEFNINNRKINSFRLKNAANSGFLYDKNFLYYCSEQRNLLKFSLNKKKVSWSVKLPAFSFDKPIKWKNHIAIILKDYNIYFFNTNGSLSWWDKLGASPFSLPLNMSENIAITLRPKKKPSIKFFNLKEKKSVIYKIDTPLSGCFISGGNIFGLSEDHINNKSLIKIGNVYAVDVKILPKVVLIKDKSIEFKFKPVNLIKPGYHIIILDSEKKEIYTREIVPEQAPSFIWFPKKEGDFELIVETVSENRDKILTKQSFTVLDIKKLQYNYYHRILSNCINKK